MKRKIKLADKSHLKSDEHKKNRKMCFCIKRAKEINITTKLNHTNCNTQKRRETYGIGVKEYELVKPNIGE